MNAQLLGLLLAAFGAAVGLAALIDRTERQVRSSERFSGPNFKPRRSDEPKRPATSSSRVIVPSTGTPIFNRAPEAQERMTLDQLYQKWGNRSGIDWRLLKAIAIQESSERPNVRGASGEIGLMQVLCIPDSNGVCTARFNLPDWPDSASQLEDPDHNLMRATQILEWNLQFTSGDVRRALGVYNGGPSNPNMVYAAEVLAKYEQVKAAQGGHGGILV